MIYYVAGTDEAGRGPLAGPVVAAAVILTKEQRDFLVENGLRDSKKMSHTKREKLFALICTCGAVWKAQAASAMRIDSMNILQASLWCMRRSVERLPLRPDLVLIDGDKTVPRLLVRQKCVIKGDDRVPAIAAASVIAKVLRDRVMVTLDALYPEYGFAGHKGYPSAAHKAVIAKIGPCPIHRRTFRGVRQDDIF